MELSGLTNDLTTYGALMSQSSSSASQIQADDVKSELSALSDTSTDEELMDACKSFESYMIQQVFKEMEKTVPKSEEDDNEYMNMFGDNLYEQYANEVASTQNLGIAQMLFESMKRNNGQ